MQMFNLIRAIIVVLAILTFTVLCLTDESRRYPEQKEYLPALHRLEIPDTDPIIEFNPSTQTERP